MTPVECGLITAPIPDIDSEAPHGGVRTDLRAAAGANAGRAYGAYVTNMISNMAASIETLMNPILTGRLDRDELLDVRQLRLTANDLATLNRIEPVEKSLRLTYESDNGRVKSDYSVFFSFTVDH